MIWLYEIPFYYYIIAGALTAAYLHSRQFHHFVHWTAIKVLSGLIWALAKTDPLYKTPETQPEPKAKVSVASQPKGIEVEADWLKKRLEENKDLSIRNP